MPVCGFIDAGTRLSALYGYCLTSITISLKLNTQNVMKIWKYSGFYKFCIDFIVLCSIIRNGEKLKRLSVIKKEML